MGKGPRKDQVKVEVGDLREGEMGGAALSEEKKEKIE